jgi:2-polyprenyl-6-methoxyphenol hydroxylase-like FAD-dependent oxidoreductase
MNTTPHFLSGKTIIISGAGIAGLSFAIALHKQWRSLPIDTNPPPIIKIFERDTPDAVDARGGYSLSLRSDSPSRGIQSLHNMGILDAMIDAAVPHLEDGKGSFCMWDGNMQTVLKFCAKAPKGLPVGGLRIVRGKMRHVLVDAIEEKIHWGVACVGAIVREQGIGVSLSDGTVEECDYLVVSDGASSKLRSILRPEERLQPLGVSIVMASSKYDDTPLPAPVNNSWGLILAGNSTAGFISPMDEHTALWSLSRHSQPQESTQPPFSEAQISEFMDEARRLSTDYPPLLQDLISRTDSQSIRRFDAKDKQAIKHDASVPVVFIGDANHAVTPFAGNGANLALADAWDLATKLRESSSFSEAVLQFDAVAIPRAKSVINQSHFLVSAIHSRGWKFWIFTWVMRGVNLLFGSKD